jgi:choline kinase
VKAVILCAGQGTRLRPHTDSLPKCMVSVAGAPLLDHQLRAVRPYVDEIVLVTGYLADTVNRFVHGSCSVVNNVDYASTNSLYSLWLARPHLAGEPFMLLNGDLVLDRLLVDRFMAEPAETALLVDHEADHLDGEMNVVVRDGLVREIGKHIEAVRADALSLQIARFSRLDGARLLGRAEQLLELGHTGFFPTHAYDVILEQSEMAAVQRQGGTWFEIDTVDDLARCEDALRTVPPGVS